MDGIKFPLKDIKNIDLNNIFLHYTNINNLNNIYTKGLLPAIGENSKGIEETKKIFFTIGDKGALIIMDVWLKWLMSKPKNKYIYRLGAYFMTKPYFPKFIYDVIFNSYNKNEKKFYKSCYYFKNILNNSVWLILDLEENVDFDFNDVDEVKLQNFPRKYLKNIYKYGSDVNNNKMEYWNMHTYSNKIIEPEKICILKYDNDINVLNILKKLIEDNFDYVKDNCELLYKFYTYVF